MSRRDRDRDRLRDQDARRELREFLVMVGEATGAARTGPARARASKSTAPRKSPRARSRMRGRFIVALIAVALTAAAVTIVSRMHPDPGDIPPALQGRWRPTAAAFAGRELELAPRTITFRAGGSAAKEAYPVTNHSPERSAGETSYRVDYLTAEGTFTLRLRVSGNELRLASRPDVLWSRVQDEARSP